MVVGVCTMDLYLPQSHSLKDKRAVLQSLIHRVQNRHHVSIAEVEKQNLHQEARVGVAVVTTDSAQAHRVLEAVVQTIESAHPGVLLRYEIEMG